MGSEMCIRDRSKTSHTFRNTTLQTRIERIAAEQRQKPRMPGIPLISRIFIAKSLEPRNAADGFPRAGLDMVDIVVVQNAQVGSGAVCAAAGMGYALWVVLVLRFRE